MENIILDTDSYKASHYLQYPPGTTSMFSYFESRGGVYPSTVFFGLQYYLKRYLSQRITRDMVLEANEFFIPHGEPFNKEGWMYIADNLNGRLPVRIRAVPEGTDVPNHNVLMTVESTDPQVFWIVSWLETMLVRTWYPSTVATRSHALRAVILSYLLRTADNPKEEVYFKLHDFGSRGVSSHESAIVGGMAHLVSFRGSDTVAAVHAAKNYYHCHMAGYSIPAAEHSTITAWERAGELNAYKNMLDQFAKPGAVVAVVSDSYNLWNAIDNFWGHNLRQQIVNSGATVVIRPDSGDPVPVVLEALHRLENAFGCTINSKGYKVLNHVRVIQGDGINDKSVNDILRSITGVGYSATNVAFGMGGGLLQQLDRDTQKFAYKCSSVTTKGQTLGISKDPVTDAGKTSKSGRLDLIRWPNGTLHTQELGPHAIMYQGSAMRTVYENGEILVEDTLDDVRNRADQGA